MAFRTHPPAQIGQKIVQVSQQRRLRSLAQRFPARQSGQFLFTLANRQQQFLVG
jgi:hypothetical protein